MKPPWLLRLVWDPVEACDLRDGRGDPDHGKIMGFVGFAFFVVATFSDHLPSVGHSVVIGTVVFGYAAWRTFLRARTVTSQELLERREPDAWRDDERGAGGP